MTKWSDLAKYEKKRLEKIKRETAEYNLGLGVGKIKKYVPTHKMISSVISSRPATKKPTDDKIVLLIGAATCGIICVLLGMRK